jgi:cation-transporting ATPase 13A1
VDAEWDLSCTGEAIKLALEAGGEETAEHLDKICVFARMTPDMKESVIKRVHKSKHVTMMCGDGANDVGALKSSDVGVALLSGFGDVNTDKSDAQRQARDMCVSVLILCNMVIIACAEREVRGHDWGDSIDHSGRS